MKKFNFNKHGITYPKYHVKLFLHIWILFFKTVMAIYNMTGKFWSLKIQPMSCLQVNGTFKRSDWSDWFDYPNHSQ